LSAKGESGDVANIMRFPAGTCGSIAGGVAAAVAAAFLLGLVVVAILLLLVEGG
jgi:hypothetical protein